MVGVDDQVIDTLLNKRESRMALVARIVDETSPLMKVDLVPSNGFKYITVNNYDGDGNELYSDKYCRLVKSKLRWNYKQLRYEISEAIRDVEGCVKNGQWLATIRDVKQDLRVEHFNDHPEHHPFVIVFLSIKEIEGQDPVVGVDHRFFIFRDDYTHLYVADHQMNRYRIHIPVNVRSQCYEREFVLFVPSNVELVPE